ncbi:DUF4268 domain-containing protein [Methylobacterium haplocladii]|uniref:DUF4268 domain-containing protein n=1 Tax=Methylobacterium haplocladii TaxID=1176176 RepID=UPI00147925A0|nr:DUF4268 domain-containing protein [Methylobacterium haplocladii]
MELDTRKAGFADILFINPLGMPTLVECKLWRNPEARREVVGQILDYARVIREWTFSDLQREAARARKKQGFDLFAHVQEQARLPDLDQAAFVDNVTRNLAQGRVLLLVLGDGIREGVEAIASYIQGTTGLHFTFGLVEMQIFEVGEGQLIVQPRVLTKTLIVNRSVVALAGNDLKLVDEVEAAGPEESRILEPSEREARHKQFWVDLLTTIRLDDAEQPLANPLSQPNIFFRMPTPGMWLTCYFSQKEGGIGIFLGSDRTSAVAMAIGLQLEIDREDITNEIGLPVVWSRDGNGKVRVAASKRYPKLGDPAVREEQLQWFREAINAFVNALRPRIATSLREVATGNASTAN